MNNKLNLIGPLVSSDNGTVFSVCPPDHQLTKVGPACRILKSGKFKMSGVILKKQAKVAGGRADTENYSILQQV